MWLSFDSVRGPVSFEEVLHNQFVAVPQELSADVGRYIFKARPPCNKSNSATSSSSKRILPLLGGARGSQPPAHAIVTFGSTPVFSAILFWESAAARARTRSIISWGILLATHGFAHRIAILAQGDPVHIWVEGLRAVNLFHEHWPSVPSVPLVPNCECIHAGTFRKSSCFIE